MKRKQPRPGSACHTLTRATNLIYLLPTRPSRSDQPWRTLLCRGSFQAQLSTSDSHPPQKVGLLSALWNSRISYILRLSSSSHPFFQPRGSAPHSTDCKCLLYTHNKQTNAFLSISFPFPDGAEKWRYRVNNNNHLPYSLGSKLRTGSTSQLLDSRGSF